MFTALKLAGAAYLIYLGYQSLKSAARPTGLIVSQEGMSALSHFAAFRQGLLSNVLNPKPIIFYMAFLPQFINPEYSALQQSLFMAFMHFSIAMIWQGVLALLVHRAKTWLAKPQVSRVIDGLSGTLLLGFGTRLALQES
jgi:threonine/homoserine/homoserine lactone efflux protein